jgi:hypothetical protein
MATSTAAGAAAPAGAQGGKTAPVQGPFRGGTQPTVRATGYSQTVTLDTATQDLPDYEIAPTNILRCIYIEVKATASGNSAAVAFQADAPLNVLSTLNFQDAGGTSIVGSFDTFTLSMAMKYFGYSASGDPRDNAVYSVSTGTGATGGSFNVVFRIPVEAVARTGVGSLQNQTTQSPFVLSATVNKLSAIYSTQPTAAPSVSVKYRLGGYWNGSNAAYSPTPKAFGSTQYINRSSIPGLSGASQFQLPNNGLGNPIRNLMFLNYATGAARSGADFPDPIQITYKGNNLVQYSQNAWQFDMSQMFGLPGAIDTGNGLDTGVFTLPFTRDFGLVPGAELGLGYLDTNVGDEIELIGSWAASSTLYEVVNFMSVNGPVSAVQGVA